MYTPQRYALEAWGNAAKQLEMLHEVWMGESCDTFLIFVVV